MLIYPKLASDYGHVATEHIRIAQKCVELANSERASVDLVMVIL